MYTNITYPTLQLHSENNIYQTTLFKTVAIYDRELFVFNNNNYVNTKGVKAVINKNVRAVTGDYQDLLNQFNWNLN